MWSRGTPLPKPWTLGTRGAWPVVRCGLSSALRERALPPPAHPSLTLSPPGLAGCRSRPGPLRPACLNHPENVCHTSKWVLGCAPRGGHCAWQPAPWFDPARTRAASGLGGSSAPNVLCVPGPAPRPLCVPVSTRAALVTAPTTGVERAAVVTAEARRCRDRRPGPPACDPEGAWRRSRQARDAGAGRGPGVTHCVLRFRRTTRSPTSSASSASRRASRSSPWASRCTRAPTYAMAGTSWTSWWSSRGRRRTGSVVGLPGQAAGRAAPCARGCVWGQLLAATWGQEMPVQPPWARGQRQCRGGGESSGPCLTSSGLQACLCQPAIGDRHLGLAPVCVGAVPPAVFLNPGAWARLCTWLPPARRSDGNRRGHLGSQPEGGPGRACRLPAGLSPPRLDGGVRAAALLCPAWGGLGGSGCFSSGAEGMSLGGPAAPLSPAAHPVPSSLQPAGPCRRGARCGRSAPREG